MPIIKSAKKKLNQDKRKTHENKVYKHNYKNALKRVSKARKKLSVKDISDVYSKIDKAAKKKLIHPNKAARLKGRVAKLFNTNK